MTSSDSIWSTAATLAEEGRPFVMMTVIRAEGSTPRNPGARMIWTPDRGFLGTVGGGQFEHLALDAAETHFRNRSTGIEHYVLGADADQCCGGTIDVFFEYIGTSHRLVVFGAGHVAHALAKLIQPSPLALTIVDDRAEWNTEDRFPGAMRLTSWDDGIEACRQSPGATLAVVMTCSHDTDLDLVDQLLRVPDLAFAGLIGSRSKAACFRTRLLARDHSPERIDTLHCPIGLGDTGKEPPMVAISIAAQVLAKARTLPRA